MKPLFVLFLLTSFFTSQSQVAEDFKVGLEEVNPDYIKASMKFLADDLLEGRQPGTRGFEIASRYVESEFVSLGLTPKGNSGYVQKV